MAISLEERLARHVKEHFGSLEGKTIAEVRQLTHDEVEGFGWYPGYGSVSIVIVLDDGTTLVPMQDPEGNGPGYLEVMPAVVAATRLQGAA